MVKCYPAGRTWGTCYEAHARAEQRIAGLPWVEFDPAGGALTMHVWQLAGFRRLH